MSACVILVITQGLVLCYTSSTLKIFPNLKSTTQPAYIITDIDADCDCGRYFNILIMLPNISMTYPIVLSYFDYGII